MRTLVQAIMSCLFLTVDVLLGLAGKAIFNVVTFQLGCAINAVCVPIMYANIMLPVLGFAPILDAGSPEQVKVGCYKLLAANHIVCLLVVTNTRMQN